MYLMFDTRVFSLCIFSDRHNVNVLVQSFIAINAFARANVGVQVELSENRSIIAIKHKSWLLHQYSSVLSAMQTDIFYSSRAYKGPL